MPHTDPYHRTTYQGFSVDERTKSALEWVQHHYRRHTGRDVRVVQGSYHTGVSASAGTHDKGGVVDLSVTGLTRTQINRLVNWMRRAGFAAWYRPPLPGVWGPHVHAVLIGHRNLAWLAAQQVGAYRAHRDGLAGNRYDGAWRPKRWRVWSHRRGHPVLA